MEVTREDVLRCARLAHLSLREDEVEPMREAMARMLSHAASLDELPLDGVEPMLMGLDRPLPRREDEPPQHIHSDRGPGQRASAGTRAVCGAEGTLKNTTIAELHEEIKSA